MLEIEIGISITVFPGGSLRYVSTANYQCAFTDSKIHINSNYLSIKFNIRGRTHLRNSMNKCAYRPMSIYMYIDKQQGLSDAYRTRVLCTSLFAGIKYPLTRGLPVKHLSGHFALAYRCVSREEKKGWRESTRVCVYICIYLAEHYLSPLCPV